MFRKPHAICLVTMLCVAFVKASLLSAAEAPDDFLVHEWGALLQVQGSDGARLDGLAENLTELPPFVKRWSSLPQRAVLMMKKPIVFFYSDKPRRIRVEVGIPTGMPTEWWPPARVYPDPPHTPKQIIKPTNGRVIWHNVELLKEMPDGIKPALVEEGDLYNGLRQTDACWLRVRGIDYNPPKDAPGKRIDELERFLLYRGVLQTSDAIDLKLTTSKDSRLALTNTGTHAMPEVMLVHIGEKSGRLQTVSVAAQQTKHVAFGDAAAEVSKQDLAVEGRKKLLSMLLAAGLFDKEAKAMLDYWAPEWFADVGLRAIYLLPAQTIDTILPLKIHPAPKKTVRVLAICVECLTPEREAQISADIRALSAESVQRRDQAMKALEGYGPLAESLLMQAKSKAENADIQQRIEHLLTLLRTPVRKLKP